MASETAERALRVGIVQDGTLVEERLIRRPGPVTVGRAARSTFVVPSPGVPARWRLIDRRRGRYLLRLAPGMHGRIASGEAAPVQVDPGRAVVLPATARGRVTLPDGAILFQFVAPPPVRPRPRLPASLARAPWSELDVPFAVAAVLSLLVHTALVLTLRSVDWPRRPDFHEIERGFVTRIARARTRPPLQAQRVTPAPESRDPVVSRRKPPAAPKTPVSAAERRARLSAEVHRTGFLQALTALGPGGAAADLLRAGSVDRDQAAAFRDVTAVQVAVDPRLGNLLRPSGGGTILAPADLRVTSRIDVADVGPAGPERGVPQVRAERPESDDPRALGDPGQIARVVRARLAGIRACYERALKRKPDLAGKLVLRLVLSSAGTVTAVEIDEDTLGDAEVASCVRALVARWRFPSPPGGSAEFSFPFVFQPSAI